MLCCGYVVELSQSYIYSMIQWRSVENYMYPLIIRDTIPNPKLCFVTKAAGCMQSMKAQISLCPYEIH